MKPVKIQRSAEDYLETILVLYQRTGAVRSIDIANEMDFSKPSVSTAMKRLRENGSIVVDGGGYITLTPQGEAIARQVYERHTTLTQMLMALGVREETAREDACRMEHVISQESFDRLKEHMAKGQKPIT